MNYELRITKYFFILCLYSLFLILYPPHTAFAQSASQTLRVSPVIIPMTLLPGKQITQEISLENLSNDPLPLRAGFNDFEQASEDGGYIIKENTSTSLASWMHLSEQNFIIPAHTKKLVLLTITLPKTIPIGGYYSLIFFDPVIHSSTTASLVQSRIGILVLGNIDVSNMKSQKADILDFSLGDFIHEKPITPLLLRVENVSLHHISAKPQLVLTPLFGEKTKMWLEEKYIFPGKIRRWNDTILLPITPINFYRARMIVSTGNGEQVIADTIFISFPFTPISIGIIISIAAITLLIKRKQIREAMSILFTGSETLDKPSKNPHS